MDGSCIAAFFSLKGRIIKERIKMKTLFLFFL